MQTEQVQVTAAVQWQLHDFLLLDDVAELGVSGFNLDWIGSDSDFLLAGGDLQNDVNAAPIVDGENNPTHDKRPKSGGVGTHLVPANWKCQEAKLPGCVCSGLHD